MQAENSAAYMYSHIVDLADVLQDKVSKRLYELQATPSADDEEVRKLFLNFQKELLSAEDTEEGFMDSIFTCLDSEAILRMEDMLAGPIGRFVRFVLSEDYFDLFRQFLKIEELCAFSLSSMYIPSGGKRPLLHIHAICYAIKDLFALDAMGADDEELLNSCRIEESVDGDVWYLPNTFNIIGEWLTVKIGTGDEAVVDYIANELSGKDYDYSKLLCELFITPVFKSANHRLLVSIIRLLRHQEDYFDPFEGNIFYQHIGITPESMLFLLDSIEKNNQSVTNLEFLLYLMLFPQEDLGLSENQYAETLSIAAKCLRDSAFRRQLLSDTDYHKVYIALWAIGFYDADEAWNVSNELIEDERPQSKKVVLAYYQNHWAKKGIEVITQRINQQR